MEISLIINNDLVFNKLITGRDVIKASVKIVSITITLILLFNSVSAAASTFNPVVNDLFNFNQYEFNESVEIINKALEHYKPLDREALKYIKEQIEVCGFREVAKNYKYLRLIDLCRGFGL